MASDAAATGPMPSHPPAVAGWVIWGLGATVYGIGFFQRTAPAVMTSELMADFGITAASLGHLASFYFYSYVVMLIPAGILVNAYGPRKLLTLCASATGIGLVVYALAPRVWFAGLGLAIVGAAGAFAMVLTLELAGRWLPRRRFALASGLTIACGVIGALLAGFPLRVILLGVGWRPVMLAFSALSLILAFWIWRLVRDDPSERGYRSYLGTAGGVRRQSVSGIMRSLRETLYLRNTWLMLIVPGGIVGATLSFCGLWGVPYLRARYGLPTEHAALVCSLLLAAMAFGSPIIGLVSDRIGRRKPPYVASVAVAAAGWLVVVYVPSLPFWALVALLSTIGFTTGVGSLSYAIGRESAPAPLSGAITGVVITGIMIGPALIQPVTGILLDLNWTGAMEAGVRVYEVRAFEVGFIPALAWTSIAALVSPLLRETWCGERKGAA